MKRGKDLPKSRDAVPLKPDAQDKERHALLLNIEGDLPYNRTLYVHEAKRYLKRSIEDILTVGKLLLVIQEREKGQFREIVEQEIGIPHTTAYRFMNAALKSEAHPAINLSQLGQVSKVYALLEAPEEEFQKLEQLGLFAGKNTDELMSMSHKELRDIVRQLKGDTAKIVDEAVSTYKSQNDLLKKELDDFLKIVPLEKKNASRSEKRLLYAQAKYDQFEAALSVLAFNMMEAEDIKIGAKIEGLIKTCLARLLNLGEQWEKHKKGAAR